jgi:hypothetical protein
MHKLFLIAYCIAAVPWAAFVVHTLYQGFSGQLPLAEKDFERLPADW